MTKMLPALIILSSMTGLQPVWGWSASDLETKLERWMTAEFPVVAGRWEVWLIDTPAGSMGLDLNAWKVQLPQHSRKAKKIMNFQLVRSGEQVTVKTRVACFKKVVVAKKTIHHQQLISRQDWQLAERLSSVVPHDALIEGTQLNDYRSKKTIARNEIITRHSIEKKPVVATGERLTLKVQGQHVVIKTDATSLEEGHAGDWIKLQQCETGRVIKAKVVESGLTEIVLNRRQ